MRLAPAAPLLRRGRVRRCRRLDRGEGRHIELVVGGVIPPGDIPALEAGGAAAVFLPGTKSTDAAARLLDLLARRRNIS